ncbi:hypothetical protein ACNOYE_16065 [Nannocystaceae bacterium ST9]
MARGRVTTLMLAAWAGVLASSCQLDPSEGLSCGDGYVSDAEECDPADPNRAFLDACRERGFPADASCDPETCRIRAEDRDCNVCGDGVAADGEECDGEDLDGELCWNGDDALRCNPVCELDYDDCVANCGHDGVVSESEECDPSAFCSDDLDCHNGTVCSAASVCVRLADDLTPIDACSELDDTFVLGKRAFVTGELDDCRSDCRLDREECGFCGDGVLDGELQIDLPGAPAILPELCDGAAIDDDDLAVICEPQCADAMGLDRRYGCDFACKADCSGSVGGVTMGNPGESCCLLAGELCFAGETCCNGVLGGYDPCVAGTDGVPRCL